jgi:hypothetical protein
MLENHEPNFLKHRVTVEHSDRYYLLNRLFSICNLCNIAKSESSDFLQSEMTSGILACEVGAMLVLMQCLEMVCDLE